MLTPDYLKTLPDPIIRILYEVEDYTIADIARRIRKMGTATSTAELQRITLQALGEGTAAINEKIAEALKVSEKEIERIFAESEEIATDNQAAIAEKLGVSLDTGFARRIGEAAVKAAMGDLANLTRTAGYIMQGGQFTMWTDAYRQALSFAQMQVATGAIDYNTAIRQAIRPFTAQGMTTIGYASGRRISIEAAARQCILGGVKDMAAEVMKKNAEDIGADGWEITAHAACAEDHQPYQGRQFRREDYEALNNVLARPIGTLNCRHMAFPVLLGISEPMYSEKQLQAMKAANKAGLEYEGKHYTLYEAEQMQRQLERSIRKTKRELIGADEAGLHDDFTAKSIKLRRLRDYYSDFSNKSGLLTQNERAQVAGYGRGISGKVLTAERKIEGIVTSTGIKTNTSKHMFDQAKARSINVDDIPSALTSPLKIGKIRADRTQQFVGEKVTAAVNVDTGRITTVWKTSSKLAARLKGRK